MATKLDKTLTRESTEEYDERNIMVTMEADQKISMKLKGMKSGTVSIGIFDLYKLTSILMFPKFLEHLFQFY